MKFSEVRKSERAWAKLKFRPPENGLAEWERIKHLVKHHRADYGKGWMGLTLHGMKPHWTEAIDRYSGYEDQIDWEIDYHFTEIAEFCPSIVNFVQSLPFVKLHRVRFMYLKAGGIIDYHRDADYMNLSPINISFNNPRDCNFKFFKNEQLYAKVPFTNSSTFLVNVGLNHRIDNNSDEDRLHMIVHGRFNQDFEDNFLNYVEAMHEI
jgi:hypothetical protein